MRLQDKARCLCSRRQVILMSICLCVLLGVTVRGIFYAMSKQVSIIDESGAYQVNTFAATVEELFEECGVTLAEGDETSLPLTAAVDDRAKIEIARAKPVTLQNGDEVIETLTTAKTVAEFLEDVGVEVGGGILSVAYDTPVTKGMQIGILRRWEDTVTVEEEIPFQTTNRPTANLGQGKTRVAVEGKNGLAEKTYRVLYEDGVEVGRELVATTQVQAPVNKVVEYGKTTQIANVRGNVTSRSGSLRYRQIITANASAYTAASCGKAPGSPGYGITATGRRAAYGTVAVDPSVIPLGTRLYIESSDGRFVYGEAVAADVGSAIRGAKVDLYFETLSECRNFGRRTVKVYVLE